MSGKNILVYACSGGANVAEISDRAARQVASNGCAGLFCLAGLGADIPGMVQTARDADWNVVIDGCPLDCAKKIFDRHGLSNYTQVRVTDLGIEKQKGEPVTGEQVRKTVEAVGKAIREQA
jgi:uncharacterized metal-binding protein